MSTLTFFVLAIIAIAMWAYTYFTWKTGKKFLNSEGNLDKALLEHAVHTRSSFNIIYTAMAMITFALAYFGFNLQDSIADRVKTEVLNDYAFELDTLRRDARAAKRHFDSIAVLLVEAERRYTQLKVVSDMANDVSTIINNVSTGANRAKENIATIAEQRVAGSALMNELILLSQKSKAFQQKLFVVDGVSVSKEKHRYAFKDLRPITGGTLPLFVDAPLIMTNIKGPQTFYFPNVESTKDTVSIGYLEDEPPVIMELWIYAK